MAKQIIAIVDYAMGNIRSVKKALNFVSPNDTVIITNNSDKLLEADRIVFPGQGAVGACMDYLNKHNLINTIKKCSSEKPFLGICLGLHLLFDYSEENNNTKGLGIIAGKAVKFNGNNIKIPHMGWNNVKQEQKHKLWHKINDNDYFYSVHNYFVKPESEAIITASTKYNIKFTSAIANKYIFAVQFHPEKSQNSGLQLLTNFINWKPLH